MTRLQPEAKLAADVIKLAHKHDWLVARFHRLPTPNGKAWRTPVGADGKGWPDLTLVRERTIFAELKIKYRKPDVDQQRWLDQLEEAGAEVYVWYDGELELIESILARRLDPLQLARLTVASGGDTVHARRVSFQLPG